MEGFILALAGRAGEFARDVRRAAFMEGFVIAAHGEPEEHRHWMCRSDEPGAHEGVCWVGLDLVSADEADAVAVLAGDPIPPWRRVFTYDPVGGRLTEVAA